jgi:hypothetical protein
MDLMALRGRKYDDAIWISLISTDPSYRRDWKSRFGFFLHAPVFELPAFERAVEERRALGGRGFNNPVGDSSWSG